MMSSDQTLLYQEFQTCLKQSLTPDEAAGLIENGKADAAAFGFTWIAHPDMQERIKAGEPLDAIPDVQNIYWHEGITVEKGYTDYPSLVI